ncbi:MAG: hypothetical protein ACJAVD_000972 [Porticoccaceae bacterium]
MRTKKIALITLTFIISFTLFSQQNEFEKTLGKENVETLNSLIENFETKTLKKEYPSLKTENAYKEFLKDILKTNSIDRRKTFPESKLKLNIYCVSDSTWIEERELSSGEKSEMIKTKYKCLNQNGKVIYSSSISYCCKEKSKTLELVEKQKEDVQINMIGYYLKALEGMSNKSKFVEYYLKNIKITADPIHTYRMSEYILNNNVDLNDYFTKRLIFINMIYR